MTTITLTATPDGEPAPFIEVTAEDFDPGVETVTVWRSAAGRQFKVRGLVGVSAGGTVNIRDFEAPFGVESSYRVEQFDSAGDFVAWSLPEVATLDSPALRWQAWFHNPFEPQGSVRVELMGQRDRSLSRPVNAEVFQVQARSVGVTVFNGPRRGLQRVVLDCVTLTDDDEAKFDALFGGYDDTTIPVVCVRTHPASRLPGTLFALVSAAKRPIDLDPEDEDGRLEWAVEGDEVAPPAEGIVTVLLGYDDFTAFYADYAEFTAAYTDYRQAQLDYSIAGTA